MSEDTKKDDVKDLNETANSAENKAESAENPENVQSDTGASSVTEPEQKKKHLILRTLLLAVLVVAAAFAIRHHMLVKEYNSALKLKSAGNYEAATPKFELLVKRSYGEIRKNANIRLLECYIESGHQQKAEARLEVMASDPSVSKVELAKCYISLGESPANNAAESKKYYKKALELAPQVLNDIQHKLADPSYVLPKPPPPTKEQIEEAKRMEIEMKKMSKASGMPSQQTVKTPPMPKEKK